MITASLWVPRGAAAVIPVKYDIDEDELARVSKLAKLQLEDAQEDLEAAQNEDVGDSDDDSKDSEMEDGDVGVPQQKIHDDDDMKAYDLEHYDTEDDGERAGGTTMPMFGNARALAYHDSNADDPYITMQEQEDEEEEKEELQVLPTDNMIVAAKVEDEVAHLEIYVYEDEADNLYVHHDIMLPAIPLCVEWVDLPVGKPLDEADKGSRGNYVAVGTFDPDIELWDLDTIDSMYPNAILGQGAEEAKQDPVEKLKKKKKAKKSRKANEQYHVDAVLSLAANRQHRNLLASSSADKTVKLWDLNTTKCAKSYSHHTDKVCSIAWNPAEATVLLSGSYDRTVAAADMRAPDAKAPRWAVESDVEIVSWDPHSSHCFYITTESGVVHYHDVRNAPATPEASKALWQLQAHDASISAFDANPIIPGYLATGSSDKTVKLWNIQPSGPSMVVSRNLDVGRVFSAKFAPDAEVGFRLAVAGSKGTMQIWDTSTNAAVRGAFANRVSTLDNGAVKEERIIGVGEDSSDDEDEGGAEPGGEDPAMANGWESMDEAET